MLAGLCFGLFACAENKEKKDPDADTDNSVSIEEAKEASRQLLYAYADSLNTVADSLEHVYNRVISEAARIGQDSIFMVEAKYRATAQSLNSEIARLNQNITELRSSNKVDDADFQEVVSELDMSGISSALEKLGLMDINLQDGSLGDTTQQSEQAQ